MSRNQSTETFHLDLRSPSQQLDHSRSSSIHSQQDELDHPNNMKQNKHIDYYSLPVFLLEFILLAATCYSAYLIHFQLNLKPLASGFYCDDIDYRHQFIESKLTKQFMQKDSELTVAGLLLAIPIVLILFCELVNSMFGALKFRKIRAICNCCKLHSITRRTVRFLGAFILGFMIVSISCDLLATSTGRLRPFFAQDCHQAYQKCLTIQAQPQEIAPKLPIESTSGIDASNIKPASAPISSSTSSRLISEQPKSEAAALLMSNSDQQKGLIVEREWIDLTEQNLTQLCSFSSDPETIWRSNQIATSWPSYPAALFTYACIFISCYLCFVGTARPFRLITCILVMLLLLLATAFCVQLVKEHYNHWEDVAASAILSLVVVIFILMVYLNRFKDSHYYESQKLIKQRSAVHDSSLNYSSGEGGAGQYSLDKTSETNNVVIQNGEVVSSAPSNNDLAMRYFQIPRANYRGAPRPLSSLNQMR